MVKNGYTSPIHPELKILTAAIQGVWKNIIPEEAEVFGADLIILSSHGYGVIDRFLLRYASQSVAFCKFKTDNIIMDSYLLNLK